MEIKSNAGFSLIEVIIVIFILSILSAVVISDFVSFKKKVDLNNNVHEFANILKLAQNKTLYSKDESQHGVYLDTGVLPAKYVLFKGAAYQSREPSSDQIYSLQDIMEFYDINLGGGNEIVFNKLTGATGQPGNISIRIKTDTSKIKTVYISSSGTVSFDAPEPLSDDNRIKDSRRVQFDYSRFIDTATETITLTFDGSETRIIPISLYLIAGKLEWQGTVSVGGQEQKVRITTPVLNNPNTTFRILRDRRYNNKSLLVTISGDATGNLAQYSADGLTTNYSSFYVSNFGGQ